MNILPNMTEQQHHLIEQSLVHLDAHYDHEISLIRQSAEHEPLRHSTRSSAHYALGLLIRNQEGDLQRAIDILHEVLKLQLDAEDEIFDGTFLTSPQGKQPPKGNYPWKTLGAGHSYFLDTSLEKIADEMLFRARAERTLTREDEQAVKRSFWDAVHTVLPPVWKSYDPNWREFISSCFAVILEHFEADLPTELVRKMDHAMLKAVQGSIDRRLSDAVPMNTNIELMHIFIADYFGHRYGTSEWKAHGDREAERFLAGYREFGTFAEFNSTTYYGVDLTVLGMIRSWSRSAKVVDMGREVEQGLWENIAAFYNSNLENLAGPFSRAYAMEMTEHSSMGVFLYLALGEPYRHLADLNCESSHDALIALAGVNVPQHLIQAFTSHQGDRMVVRQFRELIERNHPAANSYLCTASAWIEEKLMIGGLSGSRNTSGQLHPATIHWMDSSGEKYYLRLLRREIGDHWSTHYRGVVMDAKASEGKLEIEVTLAGLHDMEVLFEVSGRNLDPHSAVISPDQWSLPGLDIMVVAQAPEPRVEAREDSMEIVYFSPGGVPDGEGRTMTFKLHIKEGSLL
ncbi:hypothetical protein [Paenibacillus lemnae]|uniref:Heparinase n=1 Tax=Paenibacillus lemnae TaxID=1330551 RepID=A0A848M1B0_PAELE|nr:hypothetical protein [Paenibacillus lemnae]NMO94718.1 hypothetical protein [Paenibacillus lemnae]